MAQKAFSVRARLQSFRYAFAGLKAVLRTEHNAYIHLALTAAAFILGVVLRITAGEFMLLILAMAAVWMAELFNTAIEKTADLISKEQHPQIEVIKDVSAAAVLIAAVAAFVVGCFIFIPKLFF